MSSSKRWLVILAVLLLTVVVVGACAQTAPAEPQVIEVEVTREVEVAAESNAVALVARCKAEPPQEDGRCGNLVAAVGAANQALAEAGDARRIELEIIQDNANWGDYKTEFELASDAGQAPDIIVSGHEHIGDWATAGFITDISDEIGKHAEMDDIIDALWESTELGGKTWAIPQDAEARPFYYSKPILRELGWSDEEIESLPQRIQDGEWTWQDMYDTAQQAVDAGLVEEGDGWWHRPANGPDFLYYYYAAGGEVTEEGVDGLVFDKDAWLTVYELLHDATQERGILRPNKLDGDWDFHKQYTAAFDKVLFVYEGTWRWASWYNNYLGDLGGEDYLFENVGYALIPAIEGGTGDPITLTHPLVYMVSSQSAHPDLAVLLIAKASTKELNTPYAIDSGHLGVLKSQQDYAPYTSSEFLGSTLYMLDYTTFLPNSPYWSTYSEAYYLGIQAVESGDLTPEEAIDLVTEQLQNELGDNVVIR
ncbi:MAG: extracellular solute-binding protein [Chloroflexi bacterium]|nr:extracellular solute-binding protein [Chloroflexota bacterium]